jgi:hypothetical protein
MLNDLKLVVDRETHQLIGIFDDKDKDKFFVGGDIIMDGELFKNGIKLVKDEYIIWNIELNKEYKDCRIRVSDGIHHKKKVS